MADRNRRVGRTLVAFRPPPDFPKTVEAKVITVDQHGVRLGRHSHPHAEGFFLVVGGCTVWTWTEADGLHDTTLEAPAMFMFEPGEEHVLICSQGMVLVGYMPVTFDEENSIPATHIS